VVQEGFKPLQGRPAGAKEEGFVKETSDQWPPGVRSSIRSTAVVRFCLLRPLVFFLLATTSFFFESAMSTVGNNSFLCGIDSLLISTLEFDLYVQCVPLGGVCLVFVFLFYLGKGLLNF